MITWTRVLFWATSFQADVWSLAMHLAGRPDFEVAVAMDDVAGYRQDPMYRLLPPTFPLLEREAPDTLRAIARFRPHVVVVDNHFPKKRLAPALFVLWHGFGWKGPNDPPEFRSVYNAIRSLTGTCPSRPNPAFIWQCFGPTDLEHRHQVSGFDRENLRSLGAAMTDDLVDNGGTWTRDQVLPLYPLSFQGRKIALLAFTWHYGSVFSHWGDDCDIFTQLFDEYQRLGYAVIVRMHDRHRYDPQYLQQLEGSASRHGAVLLKFKDACRDNLLDIIVSDMMVSNYSSILNYFYATGRPSLHVYPVAFGEETFLWRTWKRGKVRVQRVASAQYIWKLDPEENGGLLARSLPDLIEDIRRADADPGCCREASAAFMARHMAPADGQVCRRIASAISALAATAGEKWDAGGPTNS